MWPLQRQLYFGCNQCGACCREYAIPLSHTDLLRLIAAHPELSLEELVRLKPSDALDPEAVLLDGLYQQILLQRQDEACLFLDADNRCSSYESRPRACHTFPFDLASLGRMRILPAALTAWERYCDRDRVSKATLRQARSDNLLGSEEFSAYQQVVARWNDGVLTCPERQTLEEFLSFLNTLAELEVMP